MLRLNVVMLVDAAGENVLMCKRLRAPYQGLYNFVGGKAEPGEDGLHAAYRELREETGVSAADVTLHHLANFSYTSGGAGLPPYELQAYMGRLRHPVEVQGDENPLFWLPLDQDFFNMTRFAGEGTVGHIVETVRRYRREWLQAVEPRILLHPLTEADLSIIAYYRGCPLEALFPMLLASQSRRHEGRYYEQFTVQMDGCLVGTVSLFEHEDGTVCNGVDIFPTFRRCGFAFRALQLLMNIARAQGFTVQTAQVRTSNEASLALHNKLGFVAGAPWINRKGNEVVTFRKEL